MAKTVEELEKDRKVEAKQLAQKIDDIFEYSNVEFEENITMGRRSRITMASFGIETVYGELNIHYKKETGLGPKNERTREDYYARTKDGMKGVFHFVQDTPGDDICLQFKKNTGEWYDDIQRYHEEVIKPRMKKRDKKKMKAKYHELIERYDYPKDVAKESVEETYGFELDDVDVK